MVREETLRAVISAKESISKQMKSAARSTRSFKREMKETGHQALGSSQEMESVRRELENVSGDAMQGAAAMREFDEQTEEAGSEAAQSAAKVGALEAALSGLSAQSLQAGASMRAAESGMDFDTDVEVIRRLSRVINNLPDGVVRLSDTVDELGVVMDKSKSTGLEMAKALGRVDDMSDETMDSIIDSSESLKALELRMEDSSDKGGKLASNFQDLNSGARDLVDANIASASSLKELEQRIDESGDEALGTAEQVDQLEGEVRSLIDEAIAASATTDTLEGRIDELGDEMAQAAGGGAALAASLQAVSSAAGEASVNVGPFNTNVRRAIVALPVLIGLAGSFVTVLYGVAAGAAAAGGALAMLFAGGLIGKAEAMVQSSEDLENRMEALQRIFSEFGASLAAATEPLQDLSNQQATITFLEGLVTLVGDLSNSVARLAPLFGRVSNALGGTFWREEAQGIAELEMMVRQLMPLLQDMTYFVLTQLPDLIAWLREETVRTAPAMGDLAVSMLPLVANLIEFTNTLLRLTLPAISILINIISPLVAALASIPDPLMAATLAFIIVTAAVSTYATSASIATAATTALYAALSPIIGVLAGIIGSVSIVAIKIAALTAVIVGLITYLDLWDDILNGLIWAWNMLIELIEFSINSIIAISNAVWELMGPLSILLPFIGGAIFVISNWKEIMDAARNAIEALGNAIKWLSKMADKYLGGIISDVTEAQKKVDEIGGVDLSAGKFGQPAGTSEGGPSRGSGATGQGGSGSTLTPSERADQLRENRREYTFDFSNSSFGDGMSERDIEKAVEKALRKAEETESDR
jgi:hypothetical protein